MRSEHVNEYAAAPSAGVPQLTVVYVETPDGRRLYGHFIDDERAASDWLWVTVNKVHSRWGDNARELPVQLRTSVVRTPL